jgi:hypothetical protein
MYIKPLNSAGTCSELMSTPDMLSSLRGPIHRRERATTVPTPAIENAPNTKSAASPSIKAVISDFMALKIRVHQGVCFRHVADIDHHYSGVVGLRAGALVLGPPKHLIKQPLSDELANWDSPNASPERSLPPPGPSV